MSALSITKKYRVAIPPEQFFSAWVSPEMTIAPVSQIECDPRVGGYYRLIVISADGRSRMEGKFLEFKRPERLVYSWEWDNNGEQTEIVVTFRKITEGTEVILTHHGFLSESSHAMHDDGWDAYIEGLVKRIAE